MTRSVAEASQGPPCCTGNFLCLFLDQILYSAQSGPRGDFSGLYTLVECKALGLLILQSLVESLGGTVDVAVAHGPLFKTYKSHSSSLGFKDNGPDFY